MLTPPASPLRIGLFGRGRMGLAVARAVARAGHAIAWSAGRDDRVEPGDVDVLLDFSAGAAVEEHLRIAAEARRPLLIGTTGWATPERRDALRRDAGRAEIGVLEAANLSLGAARLRRLAHALATLVGDDPHSDVWIEETHHRGKRDVPSGTALLLGETLLRALPGKQRLRTTLGEAPLRDDDLMVVSVRGGAHPGQHRVVVDCGHDTLELCHTLRDRESLAHGAVRAAEWLIGRVGWFTIDDLDSDGPDSGERT